MVTSPIRRQYIRIKQRYPQAITFFRLGDFYETFDEDARITSRELEITLTFRGMSRVSGFLWLGFTAMPSIVILPG